MPISVKLYTEPSWIKGIQAMQNEREPHKEGGGGIVKLK